jgi:hypothetical protein
MIAQLYLNFAVFNCLGCFGKIHLNVAKETDLFHLLSCYFKSLSKNFDGFDWIKAIDYLIH